MPRDPSLIFEDRCVVCEEIKKGSYYWQGFICLDCDDAEDLEENRLAKKIKEGEWNLD